MLNWLKGISSPEPDNKEVINVRVLKETAINAWGQDKQKNAEGYKVVRGDDGLPVEMVEIHTKPETQFAILLNNQKHSLPGGDANDPLKVIRQLVPVLQHQSEAMAQFLVCGIQLLDYGSKGEQFYILFGHPLSVALPLMQNNRPVI